MELRTSTEDAGASNPESAYGKSLRYLRNTVGKSGAVRLGVAVLVTGLLATALATWACLYMNDAALSRALDSRAREAAADIVGHVKAYEKGVRGTRGAILVGGPESLSADTYRLYAESLDPRADFPGVRGFGFIRRNGANAVIQFISPTGPNRELIGLDIGALAALRDTAASAMRGGVANLTPPLASVPGITPTPTSYLLVLPVYRPQMPRYTDVDRDIAGVGWAFAAIDLNALADTVDIVDDVELALTDVTVADAAVTLPSFGALETAPVSAPGKPVQLDVYGRRWSFTARAGSHFAASLNLPSPLGVAALGMLLTLMGSALATVYFSFRKRSEEYLSNRLLLAGIAENSSDAIVVESAQGVVLSWNNAAERMFGFSASEATGARLATLILSPEQAHEDQLILANCLAGKAMTPFEAVRRRRDGSTVDVGITVTSVTDSTGAVVAIAKNIRDVSARKQAERQIKQAMGNLEREISQRTRKLDALERTLRTVTDALPSIVGYWDRNLVNRFANKAHERWYGLKKEAITGKRVQELFSQEDVNTMQPHLDAVLRGEHVSYERESWDHHNGRSAWLQVNYLPDIVDGEVLGYYTMAYDITALRDVQRRAAANEAFLEQVGEVANVGGIRIDLFSGAQTWTRQVFRIYEVDGTVAPTTEDIDKLMDPSVGDRLWRAIRVAAETGQGYDMEIPSRTARGRSIWTRNIGVVELENGRPARVVGTVQDITASKSVEERLRITSERFALAAEAGGMGVWDWDTTSNTVQYDAEMYRLYGIEPIADELLYERWFNMVHPEDRERADAEIRAAANATGSVESEFRVVMSDGTIRHIKTAAKAHRDPSGALVRIVGVDCDVTAEKEAEIALAESEQKFRTLFEASPVGISLTDMQSGQYLHFNEAFASATGYSDAELLAMTYWDITPARFADQELVQLESLRRTAHYGPYEKEFRRKDGSVYAVLMSGMRARDASGRDVIWSIVQDISVRKALESELTEAARRDKLTGLANRALFMDRLEKSVARINHGEQRYFAVFFIDFDRFKLINDTLGHEAGDELLRQIAQRLRRVLRASDALVADDGGNVVSRFGGDEFLVLINDLKAPQDATVIAERLLNALTPAYDINDSEVHSSASIGIITSDQCRTSADDVVRNADVAMYEAKRAGRGCSVVFNEAMHIRLTRHVTIENNLRRAIGTAEMFLVYQPIVDLATGQMTSAEALIRWNHPTLGMISPSEFIPIAEECGLIVALGQWVQNEACKAMLRWRTLDPERAPPLVSVNVSRAELALGRQLLNQLRETLARHDLPPHCLQLEVTEREIMRHPEASRALMVELRQLGVKLAMDDFGTGTSSLGFLRDYPFDTIKIDRCFVQDVAGNSDVLAVIHATINLVENLGMASLAEGVEESAQVAILQSLGCRYAQGYFFSRPVAPELLLDAVTRQLSAPEDAANAAPADAFNPGLAAGSGVG